MDSAAYNSSFTVFWVRGGVKAIFFGVPLCRIHRGWERNSGHGSTGQSTAGRAAEGGAAITGLRICTLRTYVPTCLRDCVRIASTGAPTRSTDIYTHRIHTRIEQHKNPEEPPLRYINDTTNRWMDLAKAAGSGIATTIISRLSLLHKPVNSMLPSIYSTAVTSTTWNGDMCQVLGSRPCLRSYGYYTGIRSDDWNWNWTWNWKWNWNWNWKERRAERGRERAYSYSPGGWLPATTFGTPSRCLLLLLLPPLDRSAGRVAAVEAMVTPYEPG